MQGLWRKFGELTVYGPQVLVFASRKPRIDHQVEILSCVRFDSFAENPCVINFFVNV